MKGARALGWTPAEFWASTLTEYTIYIDGLNEANGGGEKSAPSDAELEALVARYG